MSNTTHRRVYRAFVAHRARRILDIKVCCERNHALARALSRISTLPRWPIRKMSASVAIFWDYGERRSSYQAFYSGSTHQHCIENCALPALEPSYTIVNSIRRLAHRFGSVKSFKAYLEYPEPSSLKSLALRSELQSCGVSLIDCPHNGRKEVADKMMMSEHVPRICRSTTLLGSPVQSI